MKDGEPWFVAKDVCEALGYARPHEAVQQHCKHAVICKSGEIPLLDCGHRGLLIIPESDLYRLIMRSNMPQAEEFQDWVVEEVLPALRKTGSYSLPALPDVKVKAIRKSRANPRMIKI